MKKQFLCMLVVAIPWLAKAQITINIVTPPSGMINRDQLWNLVVTNNSNSVRNVNLLLNLQDAVTGQSVLSAGTTNIVLSKGVKVITPGDVQPVQYNYGISGTAGKFLPLGSYVACFTVSQVSGEKLHNLATECIRLNISPLSPPLLNTPADKSIINISTPQLTWVPPGPPEMFDNLNYDVSVAEVMNGQTSAEAILYNTPLFVSSRLRQPFETYPSTYSKLQPGKTYAWQVTARNGQTLAAVTEVWTFSVAHDSVKNSTTAEGYIEMKNQHDQVGVHYVSGDRLLVKFYSFEKTHQSSVRFLNGEGKPLHRQKQQVNYGENFLAFPLGYRYQSGQVYFVEITNNKKEVFRAAFSIK